jgi:hypothetical protein
VLGCMSVCVCVCARVCVKERETQRERQRERGGEGEGEGEGEIVLIINGCRAHVPVGSTILWTGGPGLYTTSEA